MHLNELGGSIKRSLRKSIHYFVPSVFLVSSFALVSYFFGQIHGSWEALYARAGLAALVLVPLTIALLVVIFEIYSGEDMEWEKPWVLRLLDLIRDVSPLAGLLGTFLGVAHSISELSHVGDPAQMQQSFQNFLSGLSQMLITSIWGVSLAIPAIVIAQAIRHMKEKRNSTVIPADDANEIEDNDNEKEYA